MDFTQQLHIWAKGDTTQGRLMVGIAIVLLLPVLIFILKNNNALLRGMLIPVGLLLVMNLGYGGYLLFIKPKYTAQTEMQFHLNPKETLEKELAKIKADDKSYTLFKLVWAVIIVVSVILYFILGRGYYQGLSLGLIGMFFGMLLIDTFLHNRLKEYLAALLSSFDQQ